MNIQGLDEKLFADIPVTLRQELLEAYGNIITNFRERRWEPSELNGGKLCEVIYTIMQGYCTGNYPGNSSKPTNMVDACRSLENFSSSLPRSVRIQIPRALLTLYEVRNNRGVGHVGGEVNPNKMDAMMVLSISQWLMAELVRIFHGVSPEEASDAVDLIVERKLPIVWEVDQSRRILKSDLSTKEKTLLLLLSESKKVDVNQLAAWIEYKNKTRFRKTIIAQGHRQRLWEYNDHEKSVILSPLGITKAEKLLEEV